jgi:ABC-type glycerol-3-phosphate transport system permease component
MPVIPLVGRKSFGMRMLIGALYAILALGAVTMIYPFALMLSTATTGNADWQEFRFIPRFWTSQPDQFRKYVIDKNLITVVAYDYGKEYWFNLADVRNGDFQSFFARPKDKLLTLNKDYTDFLAGVNPDLKQLHFVAFGDSQYSPLSLRKDYFLWLARKYGTIECLNHAYRETARQWEEAGLPRGYNGTWEPEPLSAQHRDWRSFVQTRPDYTQRLISLNALTFFSLRAVYGTAQEINQRHRTSFKNLLDITWKDLNLYSWGRDMQGTILRRDIPLEQIQLFPMAEPAFQRFSHRIAPDKKISFTPRVPLETDARNRWMRFVRSAECKQEFFDPIDPENLWQKFLLARYGTLARINLAYGTTHKQVDAIRLPAAEVDFVAFQQNRPAIVKKFLFGNFQMVINFVLLHGRAFVNTIILVFLSIGAALTVNPMAAYVLSRFRLKYAHHILIFLLATMAFPAEVVMIPSFLLVKDFPLGGLVLAAGTALLFIGCRMLLKFRLPLFWSVLVAGLLAAAAGYFLPPWIAQKIGRPDLNVSLMNTFWVLVLPGLASGYSIFLLKGFFDSLPPELYEAAMLDGASELRMFLVITLPLCKPILAVIALGAFTAAYGSFMFAFLTCQDPAMWTLMVFLYQLQQTCSVPIVMASLIIAAIPTLIVFILAQNIILRGIVIPTFK